MKIFEGFYDAHVEASDREYDSDIYDAGARTFRAMPYVDANAGIDLDANKWMIMIFDNNGDFLGYVDDAR
jgi:hypothetical protein